MQIITEKNNQRVAESFNAVISNLNHIADDIKQSCADAIMEDDYGKVDMTKASAMELKSFIQEVANLSTRWNKGVFSKSKTAQRVVAGNLNASRTRVARASNVRLRVTFLNNGKQIYLNSSAKTFVEALRILKLDYVAKLGIIANRHELVSKTKFRSDGTIHQCEGWYIDTLSNTNQKKVFLEEISTALKISIRVDVG